jgi:hypothetical protein
MEDNEIIGQVIKTNAEFYHAFESLSIDMMDKLWKHDENVVCIHPGWDLFTGWLAIRESSFSKNAKKLRVIIVQNSSGFCSMHICECYQH